MLSKPCTVVRTNSIEDAVAAVIVGYLVSEELIVLDVNGEYLETAQRLIAGCLRSMKVLERADHPVVPFEW